MNSLPFLFFFFFIFFWGEGGVGILFFVTPLSDPLRRSRNGLRAKPRCTLPAPASVQKRSLH